MSHVNFRFLLRSADSEPTSRDIVWWGGMCCLWVQLQGAVTSRVAPTLSLLGFSPRLSSPTKRAWGAREPTTSPDESNI